MNIHIYTLSILVIIISACSPFSQTPPAIAPYEATIEPIATTPRFTLTYEATKVLTPTNTTSLQHPTSTLAPNWQGIPVIPGAFRGEAAGNDCYIYQINMSIDDAEKFYLEKLQSSGLTLYKYHKSEKSAYGSDGIFMEFKKDGDIEISQVIIAIYPKDNSTIITLAKYRLGG